MLTEVPWETTTVTPKKWFFAISSGQLEIDFTGD
jgi:hypothetical protein